MKVFLSTVRKYKNKDELLHLRTVKYGRRTPKSIFFIRLHYVKIVGLCEGHVVNFSSQHDRRGSVKGKELKNYRGVLNLSQ